MIALALRYWWVFAIAGLLATVGWQQVRVSSAQNNTQKARAEFSDYRTAAAESARLAERSRRDTEQRWASVAEGVSNEGQQKIDRALADAERAGAAEQRLQQRIATFLSAIRRTATDTGIAVAGATTGDPTLLLADLFGRARERARLLGRFADDAHGRGQTCERYADGLQAPDRKAAP